MYEAFYELRGKPFSILPDPDMIYWGRQHSMAFTMLEFGVENNAGFTVITGEIGSGKTTLVRHLLKRLPPKITTGLISNSPQGRHELLQWIMMSLNRPFEGDYPTLFRRLEDFLHGQYSSGRRTMLIIDEAQNLEPEALEDARRIPRESAGYVVWGEYGRILDGYLDVFGPDQLLVLFSDDLQRAPRETLSRDNNPQLSRMRPNRLRRKSVGQSVNQPAVDQNMLSGCEQAGTTLR